MPKPEKIRPVPVTGLYRVADMLRYWLHRVRYFILLCWILNLPVDLADAGPLVIYMMALYLDLYLRKAWEA